MRRGVLICVVIHLLALGNTQPSLPWLGWSRAMYYPRLWAFYPDASAGSPYYLQAHQAVSAVLVLAMVACYLLVYRKLRTRRRIVHPRGAEDGPRREDVSLSMQFAIVTSVFLLVIVIIGVHVSYTDGLAHRLMESGDGTLGSGEQLAAKWVTILHLLSIPLNTGVNPLVYVIINKRMRRAMIEGGMCCVTPNTVHRTGTSATSGSNNRDQTQAGLHGHTLHSVNTVHAAHTSTALGSNYMDED